MFYRNPMPEQLFEIGRKTFDTPEFRGITFIESEAKSIINRVPGGALPFDWTINPYRGCSHACTYCFARPTHTYLDMNAGRDFDTKIVVKVNAPQVLRRELAAKRWRGEHIAMGTPTGPRMLARLSRRPGSGDRIGRHGARQHDDVPSMRLRPHHGWWWKLESYGSYCSKIGSSYRRTSGAALAPTWSAVCWRAPLTLASLAFMLASVSHSEMPMPSPLARSTSRS